MRKKYIKPVFVNQKEMVSKMFAGEEAGFQFLYYLNITYLRYLEKKSRTNRTFNVYVYTKAVK